MRELKNVIERAVILSKGKVLRLDLSAPQFARDPLTLPEQNVMHEPLPPAASQTAVRTEAEMRALARANTVAALEAADWRVSGKGGAAELLGLRPTTLADRIRAMNIERGEGQPAANDS